MIEVRSVLMNPSLLREELERRGFAPAKAQAETDRVTEMVVARRTCLLDLEALRQRRNGYAKLIGLAKTAGNEALTQQRLAELEEIKALIRQSEAAAGYVEEGLFAMLEGLQAGADVA